MVTTTPINYLKLVIHADKQTPTGKHHLISILSLTSPHILKWKGMVQIVANASSLVVLVVKIALLSVLTLCASERVVLREHSDGSCKFLEEVILALCHFLYTESGPFIYS